MMLEDVPGREDEGEEVEEVSSTYLTFDLGGQTLGVEVRHVREILDLQPITRLPNAPMEVRGVVDVRGSSIPIVELSARLGMPPVDAGDDARIVVVEIDGGRSAQPFGFLADHVRKVEQIALDEIEASPSLEDGGWDSRKLKGLSRRGDALVVLLDLQQVFALSADPFDLSAGAGIF